MTIFCSALGSSRRPPTSPSNVVVKKTLIFTNFAPNSTLFGVGGEGSLVLVISLEKVPTLSDCLNTTLFRKLDVVL